MKKKQSPIFLSFAFIVAITIHVEPVHASTVEETVQKQELTHKESPNVETSIYHAPTQRLVNEVADKNLEMKESKQLHAIMPYLEKAEKSRSGEDMYFAQLLSRNLPEKEKNMVKERLKHISINEDINQPTDIDYAEKEVAIAEKNYKNEKHLRKAQKTVASLHLSEERTALVERLQVIHMQLVEEKTKNK